MEDRGIGGLTCGFELLTGAAGTDLLDGMLGGIEPLAGTDGTDVLEDRVGTGGGIEPPDTEFREGRTDPGFLETGAGAWLRSPPGDESLEGLRLANCWISDGRDSVPTVFLASVGPPSLPEVDLDVAERLAFAPSLETALEPLLFFFLIGFFIRQLL
jgi:hypothetical protein